MKEMKIKGVDNVTPVSAAAARKLAEHGFGFVGRYLVPSNGGVNAKALTKDEAERIRAAGLAILLCWEMDAERARSGSGGGIKDGTRARQLAQEMGIPTSAAIYFAVDFCPQEKEYDLVSDYIRCASAAVAPYKCGVYGGYYVVEAMKARGACTHFWQCVAWSGGKISDAALAYQYQWSEGAEAKAVKQLVGYPVDMDRCTDMADAGFWLPPTMKEYPEEDGGVIYDPTPDKPTEAPWYAENMAWGAALGIINDGRPEDKATRAEFVTMLRRFAKIYFPGDARNDVGTGEGRRTE